MTTDDQVLQLIRIKKTSTVGNWRKGTVFSSCIMLIFMGCNFCISFVLQKAGIDQEEKESGENKDLPLISDKNINQGSAIIY